MIRRLALLFLLCAAALPSAEPPLRPEPHAPSPPALPELPCGLQESRCSCFAKSCANAIGGAFDLDFLWWRSENHGFSYALNENGDLFAGVDSVNNVGSIVRVQPNWDPGLRVSFGWNSDFDRWDLLANWTWYLNHSKTTNIRSDLPLGGVSDEGYYPQWPVANGIGFGPYRRAYGSWKMLYNAIDLELGRAYFVTPAFALRPCSGVRVAWLNQKFISRFTQPLQLAISQEQDFFGKNNWWGVGPRIGVEGDWQIGMGIYFLGKFATSLLYGKTSVWSTSNSIPLGSSLVTLERRFVDSFYALIPNLQLFFGLGWKRCFHCNQVSFGVDAGWEANYWWNQFNLPVALRTFTAPLPTVGNQPVTMEGLTLNFHVDY